ncbi:Na+ dependent nucleoside transporter N-terminal domain-containing protein, partial [Vibrio anguillarum]
MNILFGLVGILALIACAYLLSENRSFINWKTVS